MTMKTKLVLRMLWILLGILGIVGCTCLAAYSSLPTVRIIIDIILSVTIGYQIGRFIVECIG